MKFQVTASHRSTGQQRTFVLDCSSPIEARARAESEGFMVYEIKSVNPPGETPSKPAIEVAPPPPEVEPPPPSSQIHVAPTESVPVRFGQFARRRPLRFGLLLILLLAVTVWMVWRLLLAPTEIEHPQTAKGGDIEVGVWTVKEYGKADSIVVLNLINHSFDKKREVNFDAVSISDEAGNHFDVRSVKDERGQQQSKLSVYPGYRLRQPLVVEPLLHKNLYVRFGSGFCDGFKTVVIKVPTHRIDSYQNTLAINPIDWTRDNLVYLPEGHTMPMTFSKEGEKIVARAKPGAITNSRIMSLNLYLYDGDGCLKATGFATEIKPEFEFFIFDNENIDAKSFRVDWWVF